MLIFGTRSTNTYRKTPLAGSGRSPWAMRRPFDESSVLDSIYSEFSEMAREAARVMESLVTYEAQGITERTPPPVPAPDRGA